MQMSKPEHLFLLHSRATVEDLVTQAHSDRSAWYHSVWGVILGGD